MTSSTGKITYNRPITLGSGERDKRNLIGHTLLFTIGSLRILLDPGRTKVESPKAETVVPEEVDVILLTHAHGDHIGNLRIAMKLSPRARVYATAPTKALVSGKVQPEQHERIIEVTYGEEIDLGGRVVARPIPAGHIIGSASWVISAPEGNFLFTGDFSPEDRGVIAPFRRPDLDLRALISEASLVKHYEKLELLSAQEEQARVGFAVASAIAAGKSVVIVADNVDALHEIALLMVLWQRDRQLPLFSIYTSSVLERGFAVYLSYYDTLPLASRLPQIKPNTFRQLNDTPDIEGAEPFCYFAGPASLKPPFPLEVTQRILRHGGHLIGQSHREDRTLRRVMAGGMPLDPNQVTLVNIPGHASEPALKEVICAMNPAQTVFVHGDSWALMHFSAELPCGVTLPFGSKRPLQLA